MLEDQVGAEGELVGHTCELASIQQISSDQLRLLLQMTDSLRVVSAIDLADAYGNTPASPKYTNESIYPGDM